MILVKDFRRIARVFRANYDTNHFNEKGKEAAETMRCNLIDDMCAELQVNHPWFDEEIFREACHKGEK